MSISKPLCQLFQALLISSFFDSRLSTPCMSFYQAAVISSDQHPQAVVPPYVSCDARLPDSRADVVVGPRR